MDFEQRIASYQCPTRLNTKSLTTAQNNAAKEAEEDLLLANNYFERIGRRQKIHERPTNYSLAMINSTWNNLQNSEDANPPPLCTENSAFDAKAAIARGQRLGFPRGVRLRPSTHGRTIPVPPTTRASGRSNTRTRPTVQASEGTTRRRSRAAKATRNAPGPYSVEEAELALEHIQEVVRRLRHERRCQLPPLTRWVEVAPFAFTLPSDLPASPARRFGYIATCDFLGSGFSGVQ
ncbi:hypothetical protein C8F04DRAFT_1179003 [Mycena alexandri]|uniref:Uncharacterized protein n=1 Tax=Mycena alexandri TaxID=1745969 RepID=A0AAD6T5U7_9AGAR|nr:hypothetical protein C8F04DRAFT_1179003 [Mycena alexandri]